MKSTKVKPPIAVIDITNFTISISSDKQKIANYLNMHRNSVTNALKGDRRFSHGKYLIIEASNL